MYTHLWTGKLNQIFVDGSKAISPYCYLGFFLPGEQMVLVGLVRVIPGEVVVIAEL